MTFAETLLLIQDRGEKILAQSTGFLITDQHRYLRQANSESPWQEDKEPGKAKQAWGRGGNYWVWHRDESLPDPPIQFPEGT